MNRKYIRILIHPLLIRLYLALVICLLIWLLAPLLEVNDNQATRVALIVAVTIWILSAFQWLTEFLKKRIKGKGLFHSKELNSGSSGEASDDVRERYKQLGRKLSERPNGIVEYFKNRLYSKKWIAVVGSSGVGKSTLVQQLVRHGALVEHFKDASGDAGSSWWADSELVVIDTPGGYFQTAERESDWKDWLYNLARMRPLRPLDAVVWVISAEDLSDAGEHLENHDMALVKRRIQSLADTLKIQVPIHLVLSKCDRIEGFPVYLSALKPTLQGEPTGAVLDSRMPGSATPAVRLDGACKSHLESLQRDTFSNLLWKQSPTPEVILTFPLTLQAVFERLRQVVSKTFDEGTPEDTVCLKSLLLLSTTSGLHALEGHRARLLTGLGIFRSQPEPGASVDATWSNAQLQRLRAFCSDGVVLETRRAARRRRQAVATAAVCAGILTGFNGCQQGHQVREKVGWLEQVVEASTTLSAELDLQTSGSQVLRQLEAQEHLAGLLSGEWADDAVRDAAHRLLNRSIQHLWLDSIGGSLEHALSGRSLAESDDEISSILEQYKALKSARVLQGECQDSSAEASTIFVTDYLASLNLNRLVASERAQLDETVQGRIGRMIKLHLYQEKSPTHTFSESVINDAMQQISRKDPARAAVVLVAFETSLNEKAALREEHELSIQEALAISNCQQILDPSSEVTQNLKCVIPLLKLNDNMRNFYRQYEQKNRMVQLKDVIERSSDSVEGLKGIETFAELTERMNAVVDQEREGGLLRKLLEASFPSGACNAEAQQAVAESGMGNNLRGLLAGELPSLGITAKKSEKGAQADGQTVESFCSALIAGNCQLLSDFRDKNDSKLGRTYQDYLLSLRELERTLRSIEDSQKAAHLALEEVKKQALSEGALYRTRISREKFFDELERTALFGNSGGDAANVSLSLSSMLEANQQLLESTIWNRLLNLAFEDLQEQWATGPLDQWKQLLNGGQDNGELKCAEVEKWLTGELTEFVNTLLEPLSGIGMAFYDNEKRQEGFLVDNAAVEQISKLINMGSSLKCCAGDAQDSAEPEIISLDLDNFSGVNIIRFDTSTRTAVFDSRTGKWSWSTETRGELGIEFQLTGGRGIKYTRLGGSLTEILERRAVLSGKVADIRLRPQEGPDGQSGGKIRLILSDDAFAKREKQGCSDSIDIRRLRLPERLVKRDFSSLKMTRE